MCVKLPYCNPRIDSCMEKIVKQLNLLSNYKTLACCCGHGKYKRTIIIKNKEGHIFELYSRKNLVHRKRNRYYKKDPDGIYYIPEISGYNDR